MAVGIQVFIGIRSQYKATDPEHVDTRTLAPTFEECMAKIDELKLTSIVPACRTLIIKGQMRDR